MRTRVFPGRLVIGASSVAFLFLAGALALGAEEIRQLVDGREIELPSVLGRAESRAPFALVVPGLRAAYRLRERAPAFVSPHSVFVRGREPGRMAVVRLPSDAARRARVVALDLHFPFSGGGPSFLVPVWDLVPLTLESRGDGRVVIRLSNLPPGEYGVVDTRIGTSPPDGASMRVWEFGVD